MTVFFDRRLGRRAALAFAVLGLDVELHDTYFAQDTPDVQWIRNVGARGWIILTQDRRIPTNRDERHAAIEAGAACFLISHANASRLKLVGLLAGVWDEIERLSEEEPRPFVYLIHNTGIFERRPLNP